MVCALATPHTSLYNLYVLAELIVAQGFHYFIWLNLQRSYLLYPPIMRPRSLGSECSGTCSTVDLLSGSDSIALQLAVRFCDPAAACSAILPSTVIPASLPIYKVGAA